MDRLFCALCLPENFGERISAHIEQIKPAFHQAHPVWTQRSTYHITLHFFGEVDRAARESISRGLAGEEFRHSRPRLRSIGHLLFPNRASPRVLSLAFKITPDDCLAPLIKNLRIISHNAGTETELKTWKPHLTLARLKNPIFFNIESLPRPPLFEFEPNTFDLVLSELTPRGPRYTILQRYKFC